MPPADKPRLDIEALRKKHKELEKHKTTAEANLATASDQLAALRADAVARYGTDELAALKLKLQEMKEQNELKRAQYQAHLEEIDTRLAQVESEFSGK